MNKDFARGMIVSMALKALPVRKKSPIAYLYNGVRLPALPEWDRDKYPYAVICDSSSITAPEQYRLFVSSYPFVRNGDEERITTSVVDSEGFNWYCTIESRLSSTMLNVWTDFDEITFASAFSQKGVWANHDILDANGEVYIAASDPIPIYNEPTEYLYNGVRLPKLPESEYPYLSLQEAYGAYRFIASSKPLYVTVSASSGAEYVAAPTDAEGRYWTFRSDSESWGDGTNGATPIANKPIFWANYDVEYEDGAAYLSASEPVPVYE